MHVYTFRGVAQKRMRLYIHLQEEFTHLIPPPNTYPKNHPKEPIL